MSKQQYVLTLELNDNQELIRLYEQYHQPGAVWPEVLASIRESGIIDMQIYRLHTLLVMVLQTTVEFRFDNKAKLDTNNAKVQEWERLMERFQKVEPQNSENGKWQIMVNVFALKDNI